MPAEAADKSELPSPAYKTAAQNPWYLLATAFGEQLGPLPDNELHDRNRRIWNGWSCGQLSEARRVKLAQMAKLRTSELAPWTPQERKIVERIFADRGIALPSHGASVDFSNLLFKEQFNISGFIFHNNANFSNANFAGRAEARHAVFNGVANFTDSVFCETVIFDSSIFSSNANFQYTFFGGISNFNECKFFDHAWFMRTKFEDFAFFDNAVFSVNGAFRGCSFKQVAKFAKSTFKSGANFSDSQFERTATFLEVQFSTRFPKLSGAILHENTTFTARDEFWPKTTEAPPEESRESLAIIRYSVGKQGLPEDEHYFFRREMAFAARIGGPLQRLPYQLFVLLSNFGHSLAKPTLWLSSFWLAGLLAYTYWLTCLAPTLADAHPIITAAGFSVAQLFAFLGFAGSYFGTDFLDALPTALKVLAGLQTVAGVVLLFFLGLGLRNRFRLN
jgi:hypothetical protein